MTVTACVSVFAESAVEVAVRMTLLGVGGALYVVALALAVCIGEKVPQLPKGEHDQSMPALLGSLATVAMSEPLWPCTIVAFGTFWMIDTEIGRTIVTAAWLDADRAAVACATIVTTGLEVDGTSGGAVKTAGAPLAVCEGVIVPHGVLAQLTFQVTPEFVGSFCTTAATVAVALINIVAGGCWVMVIVIGADTWNVAIALKL